MTRLPVDLSRREIALARFVAIQRSEAARQQGFDTQKYGCDERKAFMLDVLGSLGELAAAKALNRYWTGAGTTHYDDKDLGYLQVRTTDVPGGCLLIRPHEEKLPTIHMPWVLVIQHALDRYELAGWIVGRDGLRREYFGSPNNRQAAYWVPQAQLRGFDDPHWRAAMQIYR
jgi:hypothetical protein